MPFTENCQKPPKELPPNFDFKSLNEFFLYNDSSEWIEQKERELWAKTGASANLKSPLFHSISQPKTTYSNLDLFKASTASTPSRITGFKEWKIQTERLIHARSQQSQLEASLSMLNHRVEKARTRWACITAKSQRPKKSTSGMYHQLEVYDQMTCVKPKFERDTGIKPPERQGEVIQTFTERSRQRMMSRFRKLNKGKMKARTPEGKYEQIKKPLPLPYFVTLTYHKNYQDCQRSKEHLNAFFQRWRRRSENFAYVWKMEPQERGAIHYHLAMFIPEECLNNLSRFSQILPGEPNKIKKIDLLRNIIQQDWAEVTAEIDGVDVPFTRLDYIRKTKFKTENYKVKSNIREVSTRCANPRVEYKIEPDFEHKYYGTNVREVDNWKQFLGYVGDYMKKELGEYPFGAPALKSARIVNKSAKFEAPPARWKAPDIKTERKKTGRFWGYSYNLDFEALHIGLVDQESLQNMNDFCNAVNALAFRDLTDYLVNSANRIKKTYAHKPALKKRKLKRLRHTYESQKRRFLINRDKIDKGYSLQWEINASRVEICLEFLKYRNVKEFFA